MPGSLTENYYSRELQAVLKIRALCLAECLDQVPNISSALGVYESIRKPRTTFTAEAGRQNLRLSHMADGPEQ